MANPKQHGNRPNKAVTGKQQKQQLPQHLSDVPVVSGANYSDTVSAEGDGHKRNHSDTDHLISSRNYWRTRCLHQGSIVNALSFSAKKDSRRLAHYRSKIAQLETQLADAFTTGKKLLARFKRVEAENETLKADCFDARRVSARLKKSDRAKGKTQQRLLSLKAHMGAHACGSDESGREDALLEALAVACQRVEELEEAGDKLLDALDGKDSRKSDIGNADGDASEYEFLEARCRFAGVLDGEAYREQKALWAELLED